MENTFVLSFNIPLGTESNRKMSIFSGLNSLPSKPRDGNILLYRDEKMEFVSEAMRRTIRFDIADTPKFNALISFFNFTRSFDCSTLYIVKGPEEGTLPQIVILITPKDASSQKRLSDFYKYLEI